MKRKIKNATLNAIEEGEDLVMDMAKKVRKAAEPKIRDARKAATKAAKTFGKKVAKAAEPKIKDMKKTAKRVAEDVADAAERQFGKGLKQARKATAKGLIKAGKALK